MSGKIGEKFYPHLNMKKVYYSYLASVMVPLYIFAAILTIIVWINFAEFVVLTFAISFVPLIIVTGIIVYWISRYYKSITYLFGEDEVRVERGVWWKMRHAVPYARVMSVDTTQGPISRRFHVGTVDIHTAGYTGGGGGSSGPGSRRSEASIMQVPNFLELRETILDIVKGRPLFATTGTRVRDTGPQILEELKKIRELLEKRVAS